MEKFFNLNEDSEAKPANREYNLIEGVKFVKLHELRSGAPIPWGRYNVVLLGSTPRRIGNDFVGHAGVLIRNLTDPITYTFYDPHGKSFEDPKSEFYQNRKQIQDIIGTHAIDINSCKHQSEAPICALLSNYRATRKDLTNKEYDKELTDFLTAIVNDRKSKLEIKNFPIYSRYNPAGEPLESKRSVDYINPNSDHTREIFKRLLTTGTNIRDNPAYPHIWRSDKADAISLLVGQQVRNKQAFSPGLVASGKRRKLRGGITDSQIRNLDTKYPIADRKLGKGIVTKLWNETIQLLTPRQKELVELEFGVGKIEELTPLVEKADVPGSTFFGKTWEEKIRNLRPIDDQVANINDYIRDFLVDSDRVPFQEPIEPKVSSFGQKVPRKMDPKKGTGRKLSGGSGLKTIMLRLRDQLLGFLSSMTASTAFVNMFLAIVNAATRVDPATLYSSCTSASFMMGLSGTMGCCLYCMIVTYISKLSDAREEAVDRAIRDELARNPEMARTINPIFLPSAPTRVPNPVTGELPPPSRGSVSGQPKEGKGRRRGGTNPIAQQEARSVIQKILNSANEARSTSIASKEGRKSMNTIMNEAALELGKAGRRSAVQELNNLREPYESHPDYLKEDSAARNRIAREMKLEVRGLGRRK